MSLKIAVVSDLHCHNKKNNNNIQESYLLVDTVNPSNQNPLESFKDLLSFNIRNGTDISADILIMPGDLTNKCDQDGYSYGWDVVKEIGTMLKVKSIIPTVGNHDVDSRGKFSTAPFDKIKSFALDFPFPSVLLNDGFWTDGFAFFEENDFRILVINSAHNHTTINDAEHGNINQLTLNEIEERLKQQKDRPKKFNIAVCHHHPLPHERHYLGTTDLMFNGTQLVELLGQYSYQLVIHGHKHDPFIRYSSGGTNSPVVFSAGSFSAFKTLLLQGAYNTFHIITLDGDDIEDCENQGKIDTWFFTPSKGWKSDVNNEYFLPKIGFGCRVSIKSLSRKIFEWFDKGIVDNYEWGDFVSNFEMINFLLPDDMRLLSNKLKEKNISIYPNIPLMPEIISFKRIKTNK